MKYPRFTRGQNRSCKLNDDEIVCIRKEFANGETKISLARKYNVSPTAIRYWVDEKYRQKNIKEANVRAEKRLKAGIKRTDQRERWRLKRNFYPKELREWDRTRSKKLYEKSEEYRENNHKRCAKYYKKYKDTLLLKAKLRYDERKKSGKTKDII